jgi:hypothetical protein
VGHPDAAADQQPAQGVLAGLHFMSVLFLLKSLSAIIFTTIHIG